jgi:hypothetical protein
VVERSGTHTQSEVELGREENGGGRFGFSTQPGIGMSRVAGVTKGGGRCVLKWQLGKPGLRDPGKTRASLRAGRSGCEWGRWRQTSARAQREIVVLLEESDRGDCFTTVTEDLVWRAGGFPLGS